MKYWTAPENAFPPSCTNFSSWLGLQGVQDGDSAGAYLDYIWVGVFTLAEVMRCSAFD